MALLKVRSLGTELRAARLLRFCVCSISFRLTTTLFAGCASEPQGPVDFNPKYDCRRTIPLEFIDGLPVMAVQVTGTKPEPTVLKFLLNPGLSRTAVHPKACAKVGCKSEGAFNLTLGGEPPPKTPMLMEWGGRDVGNKTFTVTDAAAGAEAKRLEEHGLDGVLGADVLLDQEIVLNFRDEAVCFPTSHLGNTARWLRLGQVLDRDRTDFLTDRFYARPDLKFLLVGLSPAGTEGSDETRVFTPRRRLHEPHNN